MRRIGAHFIHLPGFSLQRKGYVELERHQIVNLVSRDTTLKEFASLEFYAGLLVTFDAALALQQSGRADIEAFLNQYYADHGGQIDKLAVITAIDYNTLRTLPTLQITVVD